MDSLLSWLVYFFWESTFPLAFVSPHSFYRNGTELRENKNKYFLCAIPHQQKTKFAKEKTKGGKEKRFQKNRRKSERVSSFSFSFILPFSFWLQEGVSRSSGLQKRTNCTKGGCLFLHPQLSILWKTRRGGQNWSEVSGNSHREETERDLKKLRKEQNRSEGRGE